MHIKFGSIYAANYLLFLDKAQIAQSVEQRTENPCVVGSIPTLGTNFFKYHILLS